jgi:hypothetical protein
MTDSHLTYIQAAVATRYDVYWRDRRGAQLGYVERSRRGWRAVDFDSGVAASGDARWVAATLLWPEDSA